MRKNEEKGGEMKGNYVFPGAVVENIGDPYVLAASDGIYYMYGTSDIASGGYYVWKSANLKQWALDGVCFERKNSGWGYKDFWAPEVIEYHQKFYMFYTAREEKSDLLKIGVAVSNHPSGPFIDEKKTPILNVDYAVIDASIWMEDGGNIYMYFSRDCSVNVVDGINRSDIYVVELDQEFNQKEEPKFLFSPSQEWEIRSVEKGWQWNEGPSVIKVDGLYYMTYSGNPFWSFDYSIGLAVSTSPTGPFEKYGNNPVVYGSRSQKISGPGHNSIFQSHDKSKTYIAYHIHMDSAVGGGKRKALISQVEFRDGKMELL